MLLITRGGTDSLPRAVQFYVKGSKLMKLLLVDDEPTVVKRIMARIDFASLGIDDIRVAYDSDDAEKLCQNWIPDILLSDIVMPGSNGIQMAQNMKTKWPDLQIIFISGYMEKDFLKGAIQLQAVNYIEKPLNMEELREVLCRTVEKITDRLVTRQLFSELEKEHSFSVLQNIASQLASDTCSPEMIQASLLGILTEDELSQPCFAIQICFYEDENFTNFRLSYVLNDVEDAAETINLTCFPTISSDHIIAFLLSRPGDTILNKSYFVTEYCHELRARLLQNDIRYTLGVGHVGKNWSELNASYHEAVQAGRLAFYHEVGYHAYFHQVKNTVDLQGNKDLENLVDNLKNSSKRTCLFKIHELVTEISSSEAADPKEVKRYFLKLILSVFRQGREDGFSVFPEYEDIHDLILAVMRKSFLSEMRAVLIEGIELYYASFEKDYYDNEIVNWIIRYIHQNYTDPNLDISTLSEKLGLTPTYLIHLFKNVTGDTIRHYITGVRMKVAVELLKDPANRVNDIGRIIGYRSGTYFSTRFKEYFGYAPTDLKKTGKP